MVKRRKSGSFLLIFDLGFYDANVDMELLTWNFNLVVWYEWNLTNEGIILSPRVKICPAICLDTWSPEPELLKLKVVHMLVQPRILSNCQPRRGFEVGCFWLTKAFYLTTSG